MVECGGRDYGLNYKVTIKLPRNRRSDVGNDAGNIWESKEGS